jgi:sugar/nucleoside kinase (ribokinase family)
MAKQIVSIGDLVIDLVLDVKLPVTINQHQMSPSLQFEPGGAANVVLAARHMGLDVAVLGTVGADFQGQMLKDILEQAGVDTSALIIAPNSTTTTVIALTDRQQNGHVFLGHYGEGDSIPMTSTAHEILKRTDAVFIPGYTLVEERLQPLIEGVLSAIKTTDISLYFDVGPFLGQLPYEQVETVLALTDVLLLNEEEIPYVTQGKTTVEACRQLLDHYPELMIVLKIGASGCRILSREAEIICEGYKVDVVDTVGAGDSFAGAFMWAQLNGLPLSDCGKIANAMGAASVQKAGGGRNTPTCREVQNILNANHVGINLSC